MTSASYVVHDDYRWRVLRSITDPLDGEMLELFRLEGSIGAERKGRTIWAKAVECQVWQRPRLRRIIPETLLRGRRVFFEYDERTEIVTLRLGRARKGLATTIGGLYDTIARQQAANTRRDRAHARRMRRR